MLNCKGVQKNKFSRRPVCNIINCDSISCENITRFLSGCFQDFKGLNIIKLESIRNTTICIPTKCEK